MNKLTGKTKPSMLRNVLALAVGGTIGLYFGQYFPDLYWNKVDEYVIDLSGSTSPQVNNDTQLQNIDNSPIIVS